MLLPYYIASMNIEHEYFEATGEYKAFEGICLVDTFETSKHQAALFVRANTERVRRQQRTPIFVVIGNPPYNAGQVNENDNNKNRKYPDIDKRVAETYIKNSSATYFADLGDPYVKAFRWASDRIALNQEGIVAFITNSNFLDGIAFDGMRQQLFQDFDTLYILDLGGNVRKNPKLSGTTHNVFGIQVGVGISFLVRKKKTQEPIQNSQHKIFYAKTDEFWRKGEKYDFLELKGHIDNIEWKELLPDVKHNWLTVGIDNSFDSLMPMGTKEAKIIKESGSATIFKMYSLGVATNRDQYVYSFNLKELEQRAVLFNNIYNTSVDSLKRGNELSSLIDVTDQRIKWTRQTKRSLENLQSHDYSKEHLRLCLYRPFTKMYLYYDDFWNEEQYKINRIFPFNDVNNQVICLNGIGSSKPFHCLASNITPDLHLTGDSQCFPFYTYSEDGNTRQENIIDWALTQYQTQYQDNKISKKDIFNYVYGILHHPVYREKYAANLKRELPHIPFTPDFWGFATAGKQLAELHVNYEKQPEYKLTWIEEESAKVHYRVDKMTLSKDKTQIVYNDFLTLAGIPPEVFLYRLGNRSALEWIIDQYRVSTDKRSGITNDPNRLDDPQYIVRLIGKVITVSLETVKIVKSLPTLPDN